MKRIRSEAEKARRKVLDENRVQQRNHSVGDVPERDLVAAILQRAVDDCAGEPSPKADEAMRNEVRNDAVTAYRWIIHRDKWFVGYCHLLDIDPEAFRERAIKLHGPRCERMLSAIRSKAEEGRIAA